MLEVRVLCRGEEAVRILQERKPAWPFPPFYLPRFANRWAPREHPGVALEYPPSIPGGPNLQPSPDFRELRIRIEYPVRAA